MKRKKTSLQTRVVHAGDPEHRIGGALVTPIFQSAVFLMYITMDKVEGGTAPIIREGVADLAVIEELETIRTIGEMLGDFDDDEVIDDIGQASLFSDIAAELADDQEGPRLLKFPGIN